MFAVAPRQGPPLSVLPDSFASDLGTHHFDTTLLVSQARGLRVGSDTVRAASMSTEAVSLYISSFHRVAHRIIKPRADKVLWANINFLFGLSKKQISRELEITREDLAHAGGSIWQS